MPRTKFDKPKYPPPDRLKGAILERKLTMKLSWDDLAVVAHMSPAAFRRMAVQKHTNDWKPDVRRSVCRYLGINIKTTMSYVTDDGEVQIE